MFLSRVASQYLVGSRSPLGHSMRSVSFPRAWGPPNRAVRPWTRAKRERSFLLVPSRQVIVCQAFFGRLIANFFTLRRGPSAPSLDTLRTMIVGMIAATYLSPRALTPMRNAELDP